MRWRRILTDVVCIDGVTAFFSAELHACFHDIEDFCASDVKPVFALPVSDLVAFVFGLEFGVVGSPVFGGPGTKIADDFLAFLMELLDG